MNLSDLNTGRLKRAAKLADYLNKLIDMGVKTALRRGQHIASSDMNGIMSKVDRDSSSFRK